MKIRLPDTNDIMKSMQSTLKEWFKVMKELSPNLVVYVWKTNTFDRAITNNSDITANLFNMRDFFNGINPRKGVKDMWANIQLGFNEPKK